MKEWPQQGELKKKKFGIPSALEAGKMERREE
jgi:hypothetical protein